MALAMGRNSRWTELKNHVKPKFRTIDLLGKSGQSYTFTIFDAIPVFTRKVSCIYYLSHWYSIGDGQLRHHPLYIGQTDDFNDAFQGHKEGYIYQADNFDSVSLLQVNDAKLRLNIELDLINELHPAYNASLNSLTHKS